MEINDRVKLKITGAFGTVEDTIKDHVTGTIFYIVEFDDGEFDTYADKELVKVQK